MFLNEIFSEYVIDSGVITGLGGKSIFQLILATLNIIDQSSIYDQSLIGEAFVSTLLFENSIISNISVDGS